MARAQEELNHLRYEYMKELVRLDGLMSVPGEGGALFCLMVQDRAMLPGELMERMGLTTGRIANILKRLEEKGLVRRLQDDNDRRRVHVTLTEAGRRQAEEQLEQLGERQERLMGHLGEADGEALVRLLKRCLTYLREHPMD